jgi:diacylglycerol kinase (ATP)
MKNQALLQRVGFALAGLGEGWRRERSFRTQVAIALPVAVALAVLRPGAIWWALIGFVVAVVLAMELLNSALEALVDHVHPEAHPEIRTLKDMAAGSVLLVSCGAVVVAIALLVSMWPG